MENANGFPKSSASPGQDKDGEAPPKYTEGNAEPATNETPLVPTLDNLNSAIESVNLPFWTTSLTADACLAHLKLLAAFQTLKEEIGYTDGLWGLFDNRVLSEKDKKSKAAEKDVELKDETKKRLAGLREKRWALFVARAVDRYEAWWSRLSKSYLTEYEMQIDSERYSSFTSESHPLEWAESILPPLDVLMVWHAHMLNPRAYLEDCILYSLNGLWVGGMPWKLINDAIDTNFNYRVSKDAKSVWETIIGRKWDNADDPATKTLDCPSCSRTHEIPWTTCGLPENHDGPDPGLLGKGYGDGSLTYECSKCGRLITREFLEVARFVNDARQLLVRHRPMPGTILDNGTGLPRRVPGISANYRHERTFPNRLIRRHLREKILDLTARGTSPTPSMNDVRLLIEATLKDQAALEHIERVTAPESRKRYRLGSEARAHTRKMMSRYWGNTSPFALELGGAVLRQGIFAEKMNNIDWLHSPAARETMLRLIKKYERFTKIMALHPKETAVPTLDVDLAWHTHQLTPPIYARWMCSKTRQLIDHDDKIDEDRLSVAFERTSKIYQEMYGEVYSECTCWYCESIRAAHVSSIGSAFHISKNEKISESFHTSGQASTCPPNNSAHISAHNSVRTLFQPLSSSTSSSSSSSSASSSPAATVLARLRAAHRAHLDRSYARAARRAKRRGRDLPPQDQYYAHAWGFPYLLYGPFVCPSYFAPACYPAGDPGTMIAGQGVHGACAAGACGMASGGCAGGCGGCGGGGSCGSSGPACGGGGGGCGGGGGGCGGSGS